MRHITPYLQVLLIIFFGLNWHADFLSADQLKTIVSLVHGQVESSPNMEEDPSAKRETLSDFVCNLRPPPPPPIEIFNVVPKMPYLTACEHIANKSKRKQCSDQQLREFIVDNFSMPPSHPVYNRIAVVSFIINRQGVIQDPKVVRSVSPVFDAEALRVVQRLPSFQPGKKDGQAVPVRFNIPFHYRIK